MLHLNPVTLPAVEPLHLDEVKSHCRVASAITEDDADLLRFIVGAREWCERYLNRALITQTWDLKLDGFPRSADTPLWLPKSPLQSVTSITYTDSNGDSQTWATSKYTVDAPAGPNPRWGRIVPAYNEIWPTTRDHINVVTIRFVAGYGDTWNDVPEPIREAMLLIVKHRYDNRDLVALGTSAPEVPFQAMDLLRIYRVQAF